MEQSSLSMFLLLSTSFVFSQLVIQKMNTPFITFVLLFHFSSRLIIVQDYETVTFYVLFVYKQTFSVILC